MSKFVLGVAFACLLASASLAVGFKIPPWPDFSLQHSSPGPDVDRSIKTDSIPDARCQPEKKGSARPHHNRPKPERP
jgi:hypothetical protein